MTGPSQPPPPSSPPQLPADSSFVVVVNNLESRLPHGDGGAEASDFVKQPASPKYGALGDDVELGHNKATTTTELSNSNNSNSKRVSNSDGDEFLVDGDAVCRVCHLGLASSTTESMTLGCACKQDLALCHRDCAEEWFKIRGNTVCEICGETAKNVRVSFSETTATTAAGGTGAAANSDSAVVRVGEGSTAAQTNMSRIRYCCWQHQVVRYALLVLLVAACTVPWFFRFFQQ